MQERLANATTLETHDPNQTLRNHHRCGFCDSLGLGEIVVRFTGNSLGILSKNIAPSFSTVAIGAFYSLGGYVS